MRDRSSIVGIICVGFNLLIVALFALKTGGLNKIPFESLSFIATVISAFVALAALFVSWRTFRSQSASSIESQNLVLLSHVSSEINETKRALETSIISEGGNKYYGIDAVAYFVNNYTTNADPATRGMDFISGQYQQASMFSSQIISQLNRIVQLAKDTSNFPFTDVYKVRAEGYITLTIYDFMKFYEFIFERIKDSLIGRTDDRPFYVQSGVRFYLDIDREHDLLLEELRKLGYLSVVEENREELGPALERELQSRRTRLAGVRKVNYRVNTHR